MHTLHPTPTDVTKIHAKGWRCINGRINHRRLTYLRVIHFRGFYWLVSLKRRGAQRASRISYQIRKLLYVRDGPLNQPHIATRNLRIGRTERSAVTWNSIIEFWIGTRSTPWVLSICPGTTSFMVFHYFLGNPIAVEIVNAILIYTKPINECFQYV